jgi:hypothetical protein
MQDPRLAKCLTAKRESKSVEFKEQFLPTDPRQSLEVLKDIVAIANAGGGTLAVGIDNSGVATGTDVKAALNYDHAKYCDLIRKYTLQNFCEFEVIEVEKDGRSIAVFLINPPDFPLVFERPGTYPIENNSKQITVFGQGTVYFRHGAKTETGTSDDLRKFMQHRMKEMQDQLVKGLRKVSESSRGSEIRVVPAGSLDHAPPAALSLRLTTDKNAQGVIAVDRDKLCPHRQKEVMKSLKERLPDGPLPSTHDLQAINRVYNISSKEQFAWKPEHSSRQYSDAYIDWVVEKIKADHDFLPHARRKVYEMTHPGALPLD